MEYQAFFCMMTADMVRRHPKTANGSAITGSPTGESSPQGRG